MTSTGRQKSVQDEYRRIATQYDERWAAYVESTTARTLQYLCPRGGEAILDIGCGTGSLMQAVLDREPAARVTGVDLSIPMLDVATRRVESRAALVAGEAGFLPFGEASFDAVVAVSSFHLWPDPGGALREVARVLRPGGRLVLTDWCDDFLACRLCDRWLRLTRSAYQRIYGSSACRGLVERAALAVETVARYKVSWLWGMMTIVASNRPSPTTEARPGGSTGSPPTTRVSLSENVSPGGTGPTRGSSRSGGPDPSRGSGG